MYAEIRIYYMKTIYLVRHAKSSWEDLSLMDIERPLNKRGLRDAPFMGKLLKAKNVQPDFLISSPAVRAQTTAKLFALEIGYDLNKIVTKDLLYYNTSQDILQYFNSLPDAATEIVVFGHNPMITDIANLFSSDYIPNVPTCGILKLVSTSKSWVLFKKETVTLTDFHYPKQHLQ